jgi:hypothetical protein
MSLTFGLKTSRDLFDKLKRDVALLEQEVTSDRFFNFVVTGYSLIDWVKNGATTPPVARSDVLDMYKNRYIQACGDLATASKHFSLDRRTPITSQATSDQGWGRGRYGKGGWGVGEEEITVWLDDGSTMTCLDFATNVIKAWDDFFSSHGM